MPGQSTKTKVTGIRLPISIRETSQKRSDKMGITLSDYCSRILVLQIGRKHRQSAGVNTLKDTQPVAGQVVEVPVILDKPESDPVPCLAQGVTADTV